MFYDLKLDTKKQLQGKRKLLGTQIYLTGSKLQSGELMIVASSDCEGCAIEYYCERWEIETLFEHLKSRGFNLEDTHITQPDRLGALFQILMLTACWCYRSGEWAIEQGQYIKLKNHGRPSKSLFRHGLDWIRQAISSQFCRPKDYELINLWRFLDSPQIRVKL